MSRHLLAPTVLLCALALACTGGSAGLLAPTSAQIAQPADGVIMTPIGLLTPDERLEFGADAEQVIDAVSAELGDPITETGIRSSDGLQCPPPTHRFVGWPGLTLTFLEASDHRDDGVHHLARWLLTNQIAEARIVADGGAVVAVSPGRTTLADLDDALDGTVSVTDGRPLPEYVLRGAEQVVHGGVAADGSIYNITAGRGCGRTPE